MEIKASELAAGSLQISTVVVERIARQAALEVDGVAQVVIGNSGMRGVFSRANLQKPVTVEMREDVAVITLHIVVRYGTKIPTVCENVQKNVKSAIQNMTGIAVMRVNVLVAGIAAEPVSHVQGE